MTQALITPTTKLQSNQEWFYHRIHALLGCYCLAHFIFRFCLFLTDSAASDMGFAALTTNQFIGCFLPHVALQMSGFVFEIPQKRYPDGFRIWKQYRYEALAFCCRTWTLMGVAWYRKSYGCTGEGTPKELVLSECSVWPAAVIVMATSLAADFIASYFYSLGQGSRTLRDLTVPPGAMYLAAAAQFHANIHCLLTMDRLCVQLVALAVLQTTAFFMTLRRKSVISVPAGVVLYGLALVLGMAVIVADHLDRGIAGICFTLGNMAALLRFDLRLNKYVLWTLVALLLNYLSVDSGGLFGANVGGESAWRVSAISSTGLLLVGAARRQHQMSTAVTEQKTA